MKQTVHSAVDNKTLVGSFFLRVSYKAVPQTDTNTKTGGCMYGEGLLMMSA
jgi:hypothetical protein